jgi:hypothetical protein
MELEHSSDQSSSASSRRDDTLHRTEGALPTNQATYGPPDTEVVDLQASPRSLLTDAEMQRLNEEFQQELSRMMEKFGGVVDGYANANRELRESPPAATSLVQGAVSGGFLAYVMSFYSAKVLTMWASDSLGKSADWAFAPLAGVLHATVGEVIGGGLRASFATYQSPDGALWANLVSAVSDCIFFTVGGHETKRREAMDHLKVAIQNIHNSLDERLGKDPDRSAKLAAFGALWRSIVSDEMAFFAFAISYIGSGSLRPTLRRIDNKSLSYGAEFAVVLLCGVVGSVFTSLLQNVFRKCLQKTKHNSGDNDYFTRKAKLTILHQTQQKLKVLREEVQSKWNEYKDSAGHSMTDKDSGACEEMQELLKKIDDMLGAYQEQIENIASKDARCATACTSICNTAKLLFWGKANDSTPWVGRVAKFRRALAKSIGNTAVVTAYLYYIQEVASGMHPIHASPVGNHTGIPQPEPMYTPIGSEELAAYAMHGFVLIGAWCTRSVVNTATELALLSVIPGLTLRIGTTAMSAWKWASSPRTIATGDGNTSGGTGETEQVAQGADGDGRNKQGDDGDSPHGRSPTPGTIHKVNRIIEDSDSDSDSNSDSDSDRDSNSDSDREGNRNYSRQGADSVVDLRQINARMEDAQTILNLVKNDASESSTVDSEN